MKELYFINVLGALHVALWVVFGVGVLVLIIVFWVWLDSFIDNEELAAKAVQSSIIVCIVTSLIGIFTPSKRDLYIIFGVGSVIDYVQDSDEAKQLPDKTIKMLNALADKYTPEETKEDDDLPY